MKIKSIDKNGNEEPLGFLGLSKDIKSSKIVIEEEREEEIKEGFENRLQDLRYDFADCLCFNFEEDNMDQDRILVFIGSKNDDELMGDMERKVIAFVLGGLNENVGEDMENIFEFGAREKGEEDEVREKLKTLGIEEIKLEN